MSKKPKKRGLLKRANVALHILKKRGIDKRTRDGRYLMVTVETLSNDLGGAEQLSWQQRELVLHAAWVSARLREMQATAMQGGTYDAAAYTTALNSLIGLLRNLGMARVAKSAQTVHELLGAQK